MDSNSNILHVIHSSQNTFNSDAQNETDARHIFSRRPHVAAFTETSEKKAVDRIRKASDGKYRVINPDEGDICFAVHNALHVLHFGGPLAIRGQRGPARLGGHSPRHNSYVQFMFHGDVISYTAIHTVTARGGRTDEQVKQLNMMGQQMVSFGQGDNLAIGSGDLNGQLPIKERFQRVFDRYNLTTTAQETGDWSDTHGKNRIDYIWTYDRDGRLKVTGMNVLRDRMFYSDHNPIEAFMSIRKKG